MDFTSIITIAENGSLALVLAIMSDASELLEKTRCEYTHELKQLVLNLLEIKKENLSNIQRMAIQNNIYTGQINTLTYEIKILELENLLKKLELIMIRKDDEENKVGNEQKTEEKARD